MEMVSEVAHKDGKKMKIEGVMDCRTVAAVYGMWCWRCQKIVEDNE